MNSSLDFVTFSGFFFGASVKETNTNFFFLASSSRASPVQVKYMLYISEFLIFYEKGDGS